MKMLFSVDVKLKHLRRRRLQYRSRKPALETLEGRALLSASHAMLHSESESQLPRIPSATPVQSAEVSPGSLTYSQKQVSRNGSLAMGIEGEAVQPCLRHAVACGLKVVGPLAGVAAAVDDDPPPDPEPAPPSNPVNGPGQYPTLAPSGPSGPS